MNEQPARRIMALFQAYEAFPNHPEFVDLSVRKVIETEVTLFFRQHYYYQRSGAQDLYLFGAILHQLFYDTMARRELIHIESFSVEYPDKLKKNELHISWKLRLWPNRINLMEIDLHHIAQADADAKWASAMWRMGEVTRLLRSTTDPLEDV